MSDTETVVAPMKARTAKKTDLLKLPWRGWGAPEKWWTSLLIVPSRHMHDSGFAHISIIGVDKDEMACEVLANPDDIQWPAQSGLGESDFERSYGALRTDAYFPSGVLRLWSNQYEFTVDSPTSSVEIKIRKRVD